MTSTTASNGSPPEGAYTIEEPTATEPIPPQPKTQPIRRRRWPSIQKLSIVIPALNEEQNIAEVVAAIPRRQLAERGCDLELIVVDNASTDRTAEVASELGATVVEQPDRGYGNAYSKGFSVATGDVIVTGDADCTYPFDAVPSLVDHLLTARLEFLSTNRLGRNNRDAMKRSHALANHVLTATSRRLLGAPFRDSQSGMWIFRRSIWSHLDVRSPGMPFSQEIKNEAWLKGFRCGEVPIEYRCRGGEVKLNAVRDGLRNLSQLARHRLREGRRHRQRYRLDGFGPDHTSEVPSHRVPLSEKPAPVSLRLRMLGRSAALPGASLSRRGVARTGVASFLMALVLALVLAFATPSGRHQLELSFTRVPSPFVELYFVNDPPLSRSGNELVVEFAVTAHEGGAGTYPYEVLVRDAAGVSVASRSGKAMVPGDGRAVIPARLDLPAGATWSSVQVSLTGRGERLHYTNPHARLP